MAMWHVPAPKVPLEPHPLPWERAGVESAAVWRAWIPRKGPIVVCPHPEVWRTPLVSKWHCRASSPRGPQAIKCTSGEPGGTDERDHHLRQRPDTHWHSYSGLNVLIRFHTGWQIALVPELPKCPSAVMASPAPPSQVTQTSPATTTTIQRSRINI